MGKLNVRNDPASAVASSIWGCTSDSEVADIVFPKASILRRRKGLSPVRLDDQSLMKWYKGDLDHVLSIASNVKTPGSVLEKFTKDTRLSVKRALLNNPSTPPNSYAKLASWALLLNDEEGLRNMSSTMDIHVLCQSLLEYKIAHGEDNSSRLRLDYEVLAEKLVYHPSLVLPVASIGCLDLNLILARYISESKIPSISLLNLVKIHPAQEDTALLVEVALEAKRLLNTDLVASWLHADKVSCYSAKRSIENKNLFDLVQDGCQADLLVRGNPAMISTAIVNGVPEEDLIQAVNGYDYEMYAIVDSLNLRSVSAACEEHIADRIVIVLSDPPKDAPEALDGNVVSLFLANARHDLSDSKLLALLRTGSLQTTQRWVDKPASAPNKVRVSVMESILDDPATSSRAYYSYGRPATKDSAYDTLLSPLLLACPHTPGLVNVVIKHYDEYLGNHLHASHVMRAVYPVLVRSFGASSSQNPYMREHWESFLTFACEWENTFSSLVAAVVELHRRPGQEAYSPDAQTQLEINW